MFTDIEESTYESGRHNVWDEVAPNRDSVGFYGDARRAAHTAFLDIVAVRGHGRLLDVGCGLGFFLERANARGWTVHGCEPSPHWAALAEGRLGTGTVTHGDISAVSRPGGGFNVITAWDVIEHLFEPVPFLRAMRRLLAPGGRIFLRTPNLDYVFPVYGARRRAGEEIGLGALNHVVYFTIRTMRRALRGAGLEADQWLALPPPQVATFEDDPEVRYTSGRSAVVTAKNAWARGADLALRATGGRLAVASDLDVLARALDDSDRRVSDAERLGGAGHPGWPVSSS